MLVRTDNAAAGRELQRELLTKRDHARPDGEHPSCQNGACRVPQRLYGERENRVGDATLRTVPVPNSRKLQYLTAIPENFPETTTILIC